MRRLRDGGEGGGGGVRKDWFYLPGDEKNAPRVNVEPISNNAAAQPQLVERNGVLYMRDAMGAERAVGEAPLQNKYPEFDLVAAAMLGAAAKSAAKIPYMLAKGKTGQRLIALLKNKNFQKKMAVLTGLEVGENATTTDRGSGGWLGD